MPATRTASLAKRRHWATVARITLAVSALVLGSALAWAWGGDYAAVAAIQLLAVVGWAVVYPDRAARVWPGSERTAPYVAAAVLLTVVVSSAFGGSPLFVAGFIAFVAVATVTASPLLYVGNPGRR